jgi:hypothetical protein
MAWTKRPAAVLAALATLLGAWALYRVLGHTGGHLSVPLDDAYIHFQFARAFARLEPLVYVPGEPAVAGATSLLWPALLAPAALVDQLCGSGDAALIFSSWLLGFGALGGLAHEAFLLCEPLCSRATAWLAAALVLAFGGHVWCAGSGMEVIPLGFVLARTARRSAEAWEGAPNVGELIALAWLGPFLRPEGALASLLAAAALAARGPRRSGSLAALAGMAAPPLVYLAFAGTATTTTSVVKWLPFNPYLSAPQVLGRIAAHVELLFSTLLDGRLWSATVLPEGSAPVAWLALPALGLAGYLRRRNARALHVLVLALGMLLPATYDTFLVNRLRYLWPFATGWLVGVAALAWLFGRAARLLVGTLSESEKVREAAERSVMLTLGAAAWLSLVRLLPVAIHDLGESAAAIDAQQVSLGQWAAEELPADARIAVNDAGALTFFSQRRTFDVIGLTTADEGRHWVAGPGSCFEHYERLAPSERPTHFVVYPEWLALDALLGEELTERTVESTILGGPTMRAYEADFGLVGTGAEPSEARWTGVPVLDSLDVADIESERSHSYELGEATRTDNYLATYAGFADGARARRTRERFRLQVAIGGTVVVRVVTPNSAELSLSFDGHRVTTRTPAGPWLEVGFVVPDALDADGVAPRAVTVELTSTHELSTLHYWSLAQSFRPPTAERTFSGANANAP